jgi:hypothetical protein
LGELIARTTNPLASPGATQKENTMARITPEEFAKKYGHLHQIEPQTACQFVCSEFQSLVDLYDETTNPTQKAAIEKRLLLVEQQIRLQKCKCILQ